MIRINKKIAMSAVTIVTALSLMSGATYAFFTDTAQSQNNALATGTLDITVDQTEGIFENSLAITNWQPGEERLVRFDVVNDGTLPVNLRAFAVGEWDQNVLDANLVKVTKVEFWNGSGWQQIAANASGITGLVYYSPDGANLNLYSLAGSGAREEFRLTVKLDDTADNTYQGRTFNSQITVHAKQTTAGSTWPL